MTAKFLGKVALVAGGTGALGSSIALAFLEQGAAVAVTYRSQDEYAALTKGTATNGARLAGYAVDVTDEMAVRGVVDEIVRQHGQLDALVNAVGGYVGGVNLWEVEPPVLDRMLAINLRSGYVLARAVVPVMVRQGFGAIVNVAAKTAFEHPAGAGAYAASKAAAVAMMDCLAADLKSTGVRVNTILPSIIDTAANRAAMPKADFSKWPKAGDIAQVILFLCGDEAKVVHGAAIPVYGQS